MRRCVAVLLLWLLFNPAQAEKRRLIILHTNDLHGHLEAEEDRGLVRLATLIRSLKSAFPGQVVLLDAGDLALGTPISGLHYGLPTTRAMALLEYDAVAIGNHEFNWGQQRMREMLQAVEAPVLCANLVARQGPPPYQGWTVVERAGLRLGIIGLVTPDTPRRTLSRYVDGWSFLSGPDGARRVLREMPETDLVIALTHLGVERDQRLLEQIQEIDLVVGGHSHTALQEVVYHRGRPIVQAGSYGRFLGFLELELDTDEGELKVLSYRLIPVNQNIAPDPAVAALVEEYGREIRPRLAKVAGRVTGRVSKGAFEGAYDTPLGDLICDVIRAQTGADVALYNRGGVRFDMQEGDLTVGDLHQLFPFDDPIVVLKLNGSQLARVLEQGTFGGQGPLSASGLRATALLGASRLDSILVNGEPLRSEAVYTLATTRFLAAGGDGMSTLRDLFLVRELPYVRELLLGHLSRHPTLEPPASARLLRQH